MAGKGEKMQKDDDAGQYLTERDVLRLTKEALDQGRTKQQVFEELSPRFYSKEHLAQLISTIPEVELRKTYRGTNQALVVVMVLAGASHLVLLLLTVHSKGRSAFTLFNPVIALLVVFLTRRIYQMSGGVYVPVGLLSLIGVLDTIGLVPTNPLWSLVDIALFITTAILSFHVGGHLFPHRGWIGPLKDENGNYLL